MTANSATSVNFGKAIVMLVKGIVTVPSAMQSALISDISSAAR